MKTIREMSDRLLSRVYAYNRLCEWHLLQLVTRERDLEATIAEKITEMGPKASRVGLYKHRLTLLRDRLLILGAECDATTRLTNEIEMELDRRGFPRDERERFLEGDRP